MIIFINEAPEIMPLSLHLSESDDKGDLPPLIFRTNGTTSTNSNGSRRPRRQLIEEISPAKQEAYREESRSSKSERLCVPDHSVTVKEADSKHPSQRVLVKVTVPGVSSANQVDLEVSKVNTCIYGFTVDHEYFVLKKFILENFAVFNFRG